MNRQWYPKLAMAAIACVGMLVVDALPAGAHEASGFSLSCDTVSATIADTGTPDVNDHPITWNVKVGAGAFQAVPTTETTIVPGDQEVTLAVGDISSLTAGLQGQTTTVQAFASWPSDPTGGTATFSADVTCGSPPAPPSTAPQNVQVSPESVTRAAPSVSPRVVSPRAVQVGPRFTG